MNSASDPTGTSLSQASIDALTVRGIEHNEAVAADHVRPVTKRGDLPEPMRRQYASPGMLFVRVLTDGAIEFQYRPDKPKAGADGRPMKYVFRKGDPYGVWVLRAVQPGGRALLAEGHLKGLAALQALPDHIGVYVLAGCNPKIDQDWSWAHGLSIATVLDADLCVNADVWNGGLAIHTGLLDAGAARAGFVDLDGLGNDKDGLDDILGRMAASDRPALLADLMSTALEGAVDVDKEGTVTAKAYRDIVGLAPVCKDVRLVPAPGFTHEVAVTLQADHLDADGNATLVSRDGVWHQYTGTKWVERTPSEVHDLVHLALADSHYLKTKNGQPVYDEQGRPVCPSWNPNTNSVSHVVRALQALTNVSFEIGADVVSNVWLDGRAGGKPVMAFRNGLVDVNGGRTVLDHTPLWFSQVCVPYDFNAGAAKPVEWLTFLDQLWADDADAIALLQEWFGYLLSGRINLEKFLLMLGPRRSGKGTILHVMAHLIGEANAKGLNMRDFTTDFGLQTTIGKRLVTVGDARLGKGDNSFVLERLLTLASTDDIQINRKYEKPVNGHPGWLLAIATNNPLSLPDESSALEGRTLLLTFTKSFIGREDFGLKERLVTSELDGIILWALEGLDRLNRNGGRFTVPKSATAVRDMTKVASAPVSVFLDEWCEIVPGATTPKTDVMGAFADWCTSVKIDHPMSGPQFAAALYATGNGIESAKPRVDGKQVPSYTSLRIRAQLVRGVGWAAPDDEQPEQPEQPQQPADAPATPCPVPAVPAVAESLNGAQADADPFSTNDPWATAALGLDYDI
ncbi:phage/plasmid primase, P4 family [Streptomyces sp. NBC_01314]|uniref:DNA primase family protein n=1 Tax=Streptomyces sp. NBC_01314 TaxID=2903821 RepID=UPI003092700F|nr:phage/plasmid primase, P4 family [Streptomyces sp. NBC_01314]